MVLALIVFDPLTQYSPMYLVQKRVPAPCKLANCTYRCLPTSTKKFRYRGVGGWGGFHTTGRGWHDGAAVGAANSIGQTQANMPGEPTHVASSFARRMKTDPQIISQYKNIVLKDLPPTFPNNHGAPTVFHHRRQV